MVRPDAATVAAIPTPRSNDLDCIWRGKLGKLCRLRYGNHFLPDDSAGREMLTALLCFGLTDEDAVEQARWCEPELPLLKQRATRQKRREVGKLIGLTFAEWKEAKLWRLRPVDKTEEGIQEWREDQRKESWKRSSQKRRDKLKKEKRRQLERAKMMVTKPRHTAVLEWLIESGGSASVHALMQRARKSDAFKKSRYNRVHWCGDPPEHAIVSNLRDAVHETLNQLERKGHIETSKHPDGYRGPASWASLSRKFLESLASERRNPTVGASDTAFRRSESSVTTRLSNDSGATGKRQARF
jgi:hypothetical protein